MWKFITGLQGISAQVCKLEQQFCHTTHIAHNGNAFKGQKLVNSEEKMIWRGRCYFIYYKQWKIKGL